MGLRLEKRRKGSELCSLTNHASVSAMTMPYTSRATIDLLKDTFGDRLISRFGPVNWPPRSCDLTPLDYFLCGYVKSLVYADKPQTLDHLEDNIRRVIADIRPQMLERVIENWTSRLDYIRASRGSPMPEIIFKNDNILLYDDPRPRDALETRQILAELGQEVLARLGNSIASTMLFGPDTLRLSFVFVLTKCFVAPKNGVWNATQLK
ncbi:hypothetical protein TNCV_859691 [Trichonephila clavipes]|nr:hypothetical protein TNCV_859691 [Trichonephila clavipes]